MKVFVDLQKRDFKPWLHEKHPGYVYLPVKFLNHLDSLAYSRFHVNIFLAKKRCKNLIK